MTRHDPIGIFCHVEQYCTAIPPVILYLLSHRVFVIGAPKGWSGKEEKASTLLSATAHAVLPGVTGELV